MRNLVAKVATLIWIRLSLSMLLIRVACLRSKKIVYAKLDLILSTTAMSLLSF